MPLHMSGLVSRHGLFNPEERTRKIPSVTFERVLKTGNPYHDKTGAFAKKPATGGGEDKPATETPSGGGGGIKMGTRVAVNLPGNQYHGKHGKVVTSHHADPKPGTHTVQFSNKSSAIFHQDNLTAKPTVEVDPDEAHIRSELNKVSSQLESAASGPASDKLAARRKALETHLGAMLSAKDSGAEKPAMPKDLAPKKVKPSKLAPDETSADKIQNHIAKMYGGENVKLYGGSNPYSEYQHRESQLKPEAAKTLMDDLEKAGWSKNQNNINKDYAHRVWNLENKNGARVRVDTEDGYVRIAGKKKAKALTVPYYD